MSKHSHSLPFINCRLVLLRFEELYWHLCLHSMDTLFSCKAERFSWVVSQWTVNILEWLYIFQQKQRCYVENFHMWRLSFVRSWFFSSSCNWNQCWKFTYKFLRPMIKVYQDFFPQNFNHLSRGSQRWKTCLWVRDLWSGSRMHWIDYWGR